MQGQALVRVDRVGDVAVLILSHPPVNALSSDMRQGLAQALQAALEDTEVRAVVLRGEGKGFSAGADISEFGKPRTALRLGALCAMIEAAGKPVIAAVHGTAMGGGLELALAAHYRIASVAAVMGLPEVNLGLLPGAGGTQRLPRLIGAADALRLMLSGMPVRGAEALALGMVDRVVEGGLAEAALAMAAEGLQPRRSCDMRRGFKDMAGYQAAVAAARKAHAADPMPAPARIIDCVEAAALLPFAQGLMAEETAFADLVATPQAAGLRYAFFTERRAGLPPPTVAAKGISPISRIGIWGVDDSAADLTFQALSAGMHVTWAADDRAVLVQALERVAARQEQAVVAGTMSEETRDSDWARLTTGLSAEAVQGAELVLIAPGAMLPDSLISAVRAGLGALASETSEPEAALSVPFASGGLAELSMTPDAPPEVVARLMALARRLQWRLVFAGGGGPIELHLRQALVMAVEHLTAQGMSAAEIAAAQAAQGIGVAVVTGALPGGADEVAATCLAAMAAEGARMVEDGRARRPLDVDAVALLSGLVPRWMGGPMFQADQRGLLVLRNDLRRWSATPIFAVPELLDDLISEGQNFATLNGV